MIIYLILITGHTAIWWTGWEQPSLTLNRTAMINLVSHNAGFATISQNVSPDKVLQQDLKKTKLIQK